MLTNPKPFISYKSILIILWFVSFLINIAIFSFECYNILMNYFYLHCHINTIENVFDLQDKSNCILIVDLAVIINSFITIVTIYPVLKKIIMGQKIYYDRIMISDFVTYISALFLFKMVWSQSSEFAIFYWILVITSLLSSILVQLSFSILKDKSNKMYEQIHLSNIIIS